MANEAFGTLSSSPELLVGLTCRVHPVVFLSIVDSYERRNEDAKRVIGTLLGTVEKNTVEVTNCFTVPHNESEEEVAVDIEFARNMTDLHRKVNLQEVIVGWYSTGYDVSEHSVLIHDYYSRECKNPVHITVDTSLKQAHMSMKAYISVPVGVPEKTIGTMFTPIPLQLAYQDSERVGVEYLLKHKDRVKRTSNLPKDLKQVSVDCTQMLAKLDSVIEYIDNVLSGKVPSDSTIGRSLMELVNNVTKIKPEDFQDIVSSNMKDLLMMLYLSNLTKTQLIIGEKINQF
ncbi:hypothetical protein HELRODRAFT_185120 [Helobdella robusta]|uniref:Eukaryotic translation initiation factor 3 subunit F n=1 Tax=Helobdella robusta TaxID=6412 RepID=T1FMF3_HELRO|nr:hypothetical protein HELRODRAFT_185120 [Helobdella robusta]ESN94550.1 hypothetical protein HELRODRAFT_185120 [Helobdella robusta]